MSLFVTDLRCQEVVELVTNYLEGRLSRRERRSLERHLRGCDGCDAYVEQIRVVQEATGSVGPEDLDAATLEGLVELFRKYQDDR
jgi:anti-sigma factor RsiW